MLVTYVSPTRLHAVIYPGALVTNNVGFLPISCMAPDLPEAYVSINTAVSQDLIVTISGMKLWAEYTQVQIAGLPCTNFTEVVGDGSTYHATVTCVAPPGLGTNNPVFVYTYCDAMLTGLTTTNTGLHTISYPTPTVVPCAGEANLSSVWTGSFITICGTNFGPAVLPDQWTGVRSVSVGGVICSNMTASPTQLVCALPAAQAGVYTPSLNLNGVTLDVGFSVTYVAPPCVPSTCAQLKTSCGPVDNGCGTKIYCGSCQGEDYCILGKCVNCLSLVNCWPANYTFPESDWCSDWSDCDFHGVCNSEGNCDCYSNYDGDECGECAIGLVAYPNCTAVSTTTSGSASTSGPSTTSTVSSTGSGATTSSGSTSGTESGATTGLTLTGTISIGGNSGSNNVSDSGDNGSGSGSSSVSGDSVSSTTTTTGSANSGTGDNTVSGSYKLRPAHVVAVLGLLGMLLLW